jgi:hypothetical protein
MRREIRAVPEDVDLAVVAQRVRYIGSGEHKSFPSFAGPPKLRADASRCDPALGDRDVLSGWLQQGVEAGLVGGPWEGHFPRYVWHRREGVCYEGRLVNREAGEYKGYPLADAESPEGV